MRGEATRRQRVDRSYLVLRLRVDRSYQLPGTVATWYCNYLVLQLAIWRT